MEKKDAELYIAMIDAQKNKLLENLTETNRDQLLIVLSNVLISLIKELLPKKVI